MNHETKSLSLPSEGRASPPASPLVGETVGQYEVKRLLGSGGMGMVFEGFHRRLQRRVAVKFVRTDSATDRAAIARFDREMAAIGRLHHPHIVQAFDAGEENGRPYLVMEFVEGCTGSQLVRHVDPLPLAEACQVTKQAAEGLRHAHQAGLVHRDVKPSNLLINAEGCVKVADLGLARIVHEKNKPGLTGSGLAIGTVDYMAPEQARGDRDITAAADVYSLGCTWYRLLTGRAPFHSSEYDSQIKKLLAHVNDPVPAVTRLRPDVPAELAELLHSMLAKSPDARPTLDDIILRLEDVTRTASLKPLVARVMGGLPDGSSALESAKISTLNPTDTHSTLGAKGSSARRHWRWISLLTCLALLVCVSLPAAWLLIANQRSSNSPSGSRHDRGAATPPETDGFVSTERAEPFRSSVRDGSSAWFENLDEGEIELHRRYGLLNKPPPALVWPPHPLAENRYDPERRQLRVSHPQFAMLALGETPAAAFSLELHLFQNRWPGGAGVFWGMKRLAGREKETWKAQVLHFRERRVGDDVQAFPLMLCRDTLTLTREENGLFYVQRSSWAGIPIASPPRRVQTIFLDITDAGLIEVRWAGDEAAFRPLCTFELNKGYSAEDYAGQFGVYVDGCELVVDGASVVVDRRLTKAE